MRWFRPLFFLWILGFVTACSVHKQKIDEVENSIDTRRLYPHAAVVTAKADVSSWAVEVLQEGGNAFDAMVVCELGLAVSYPFAGSLGGGGFMVYRLNSGETGALNFREKAPLQAHKDMYLDDNGNVIPGLSLNTALAIGVPGNIAGIYAAHKKYGKLEWEYLVEKVAHYAESGIIITPKQAERFQQYKSIFEERNGKPILFSQAWKAGDTLKNYALARTLHIIAQKGPDAFYMGELTSKMVDFIQEKGGIITAEDFQKYNAQWKEALTFPYKDYTVISMPPPSSGGLALSQLLQTLDLYDVSNIKHNSTEYIQLLTEIERRVYADRAHFLGDPDFVWVPTKQLQDKQYLIDRMKDFSWDHATPSLQVSHGEIPTESEETTHYSIIDVEGNAIAVTTTINGAYGSKLYIDELGFFFNNEMDDFVSKPGVPNMFGLVGGKANAIAPEKRMLSSMTPTIVIHNDSLFMVLGSPGGSTIITSVFQNIVNVIQYEMGMQESVSQPRFHHQWLPDEVLVEPNGFSTKSIEELQQKGYSIQQKESTIIGKVDALLVTPKGIEAGADPRGDDAASGF